MVYITVYHIYNRKREGLESSDTLGISIQNAGSFLIFAEHPFAQHRYPEGTKYLEVLYVPFYTARTDHYTPMAGMIDCCGKEISSCNALNHLCYLSHNSFLTCPLLFLSLTACRKCTASLLPGLMFTCRKDGSRRTQHSITKISQRCAR